MRSAVVVATVLVVAWLVGGVDDLLDIRGLMIGRVHLVSQPVDCYTSLVAAVVAVVAAVAVVVTVSVVVAVVAVAAVAVVAVGNHCRC